ncbi:MAG: NrsF family protein [Bryobacteraceae bacterium]
MTCREVDQLRMRGELPPSARIHLNECAACRSLHDGLTIQPAPPEDLQRKITESILAGLRPVKPLAGRRVLMVELLLCTGLAAVIGAWYWGTAGWEELSRGQAAVMFALLGTGVLLVCDQITRMMVPGTKMAVQPWMALGLPFTTLLMAVLYLFPYESDPEFFATGLHCWLAGVTCAGATAPLVLYSIRRSAGVTRIWQGAATGLLCGFAGAAMLEIACPLLERSHIIAWHLGAVLTAALTGVIASECLNAVEKRRVWK